MAGKSRIEWTDATWNPAFGCDKVSPGCANCYAASYARRFRADVPFNVITLHEDRMTWPSRWRRPRRILVGSLTDLFHADIPNAYRDRIFLEMVLALQHTYQVPTKRIGLGRDYLAGLITRPTIFGAALNAALVGRADYATFGPQIPNKAALAELWPLPNVWLGISAETDGRLHERLPDLLQTPAAVRFVSFEPLLGPIAGSSIQTGIDWAIVGGESGPNARPFDPDWARVILASCRTKGIPVFVKQLGGWPNKRDKIECFPADLQIREFPA